MSSVSYGDATGVKARGKAVTGVWRKSTRVSQASKEAMLVLA